MDHADAENSADTSLLIENRRHRQQIAITVITVYLCLTLIIAIHSIIHPTITVHIGYYSFWRRAPAFVLQINQLRA